MDLYNDPTVDAHAGVYGPILAIFATELAAGCHTPAKIWTTLDNTGDGFLQAYLLLGHDGWTIMIHTITHYPTLPGIATPWDGMHFGFMGEVVGPIAQPVEFPGGTAFKLAPAAVRVPTLGNMEAHWAAAGGAQFLAPLDPADPDSELICTKHSTLLPFVVVLLCLAPLTMLELWTTLGQPLIDGGQQAEMGVLLDWIQVASVESAAQVGPTIQLAAPPAALLADTGLLGYFQQVIQRWLWGLTMAQAAPPQPAAQAPQVLGLLQQFVNDN